MRVRVAEQQETQEEEEGWRKGGERGFQGREVGWSGVVTMREEGELVGDRDGYGEARLRERRVRILSS